MSQSEQRRPVTSAAATTITSCECSSGRGYPRCPECGKRFPTADYLERHQRRACAGPVGEPRAVVRRLLPNERAAFKWRQP